jgi:hypothetical protein
MPITLTNFEECIDDTILSRGWGYYKSGNIIALEYDGGEWVAEVEGSEYYTVKVNLSDGGEILGSNCDCPYDWGGYCKHQAAVFYALRNQEESDVTAAKAVKRENLETVLGKLDRQALLSIILEIAGRDGRIKEELLMRFSEEADIAKKARGVIKSAINSVSYGGFVEYKDVDRATDGADAVLAMIDDKIAVGDTLSAVKLCVIVLEEMGVLFDHCDDSNGYVSGAIYSAIEKIAAAVDDIEDMGSVESDEVFDFIYKHAQNEIYDDWTEWREELLSAAIPLCGNPANREKIEEYLSNWQVSIAVGSSESYKIRVLQKLQLQIISLFDGEAAANRYIKQHTDNPDFRRIAIRNAMENKQYDHALTLCSNGEKQDANYAGLVREWKQLRCQVYEKTGDIQQQKALTRELLIDGDFEYFLKLKPLYSEVEWPHIVQEILTDLGTNSRSGVYVKILIHEELKLQLLKYCEKNIDEITSYYTYLLPEWESEVGPIFTQYIRERAARAHGRGDYRDVCDIIKHYKIACGQEADSIKNELREQYVRRRAFLDELSKV